MKHLSSEGTASAVRIWDAIRPLPGSERPDVRLKPYMLTRHAFAHVDTGNAPLGSMAISNPHAVPFGHTAMEQRG